MTRDEVRDALLEALAEGLRRKHPGAIVEAVFVGDRDTEADTPDDDARRPKREVGS